MSQAVITHCIRVIEFMASSPAGCTVSAAADLLRVSPARARGLLEALVRRGYVKQGQRPDQYLLTMRLTKLGLTYQAHSGISDVFQPILDRLAASTGELVRMALADRERLTWVAKAQGSRSGLRFDAETGREVALHSTAAGKAWLAALPLDQAVKLVLDRGFGKKNEFGPNAVHSVEGLLRELKVTARRGYALGHDEYILGISAVAAVIDARSAAGVPIGVVSIAGPSTRLTHAKLESFRDALFHATRELSALLPVLGDGLNGVYAT